MKPGGNPEPSSPEAGCVCAIIRQAARLVTQLYDEELHEDDLREQLAMPRFALLSVIRQRPGCNQAVLARMLGFDKTTLSRNLKLIEKKGWIAHAASHDQRERGYHLTPAGSKLWLAAKPGWRRAQNRLRSAMSEDEWNAMWQVFGNIADAVRRARQT